MLIQGRRSRLRDYQGVDFSSRRQLRPDTGQWGRYVAWSTRVVPGKLEASNASNEAAIELACSLGQIQINPGPWW
jgi:hypothetical protein